MKNMTLGARNALTRTGLVAAFLATAGVVSVEMSACADGPVRCWGWNDDGQCNTPADLGPCSSVAAGYRHSIALRSDGEVRCWGANFYGASSTPSDLGSCSSVAAGAFFSIALRSDGIVRCWGDNYFGQCNTPSDLGTCTRVAAGSSHAIALRIDGSVRCWGRNNYGQCDTPADLGPCSSVAGGGYHTIAVRIDGGVRCWGNNYSHQCNTPADLGPCSSIAGGRDHTIALRIDGSVRCWGGNTYGQTFVPADLGNCTAVAAGFFGHTIALRSDGIVRCWGDNYFGQCNTLGPSSSVGGGWAHTVSVAIQTYVDTDGDGLIDFQDNCPGVYNPEQVDYNNNGIGDICDTAAVFELSVPEQFPTIQAAIDYAAPRGAAIRIGPGTYTDPIRLPTGPSGQSFYFQGAGAGLTVLDGKGTHEIMTGHSNYLSLSGLTFRNGFSTNHAGAVDVVTQSGWEFSRCEFINNRLQASSRNVNDSRPRAGAVALSSSDFVDHQMWCDATFFDNFAGGCDDCAGAAMYTPKVSLLILSGLFVRNQVEDFSSNSASCVSTRGVSNVALGDFLVADNSCGIPMNGASNSTFRFDSPGECYLSLNNSELRRNRVGHGGAEFAVISGDSSVLPACGTWWDVWTLLQGGSGVNLNVWEAKAQAWTNVGGARENSYLLRLRCRDGTVSTLGYSNPQVCLRARGYADLFSFCDDGIEPYWNSYINWQLFNWNPSCYLQYPMEYEDCSYSGNPSYYFCRSALPEDINFDRFVDGSDLAELLNSWGVCNGCGADLTANGVVDGEDLAFLLVAWGQSQ